MAAVSAHKERCSEKGQRFFVLKKIISLNFSSG
jgi:hypothetical protein